MRELFYLIGGGIVGFYCGFCLYRILYKKRLSQLGETISEGHFQNTLLAGLATFLFQEHPGATFEVRADGSLWRISLEDKDIIYRKKE